MNQMENKNTPNRENGKKSSNSTPRPENVNPPSTTRC